MRWLAVLVAVALVAAGVWVAAAGGSFPDRLGWTMLAVGGVVILCAPALLTRVGSADGFAFLGKGPEMGLQDAGGTQHLTGTGVSILIGVPLLVVGGLLIS